MRQKSQYSNYKQPNKCKNGCHVTMSKEGKEMTLSVPYCAKRLFGTSISCYRFILEENINLLCIYPFAWDSEIKLKFSLCPPA